MQWRETACKTYIRVWPIDDETRGLDITFGVIHIRLRLKIIHVMRICAALLQGSKEELIVSGWLRPISYRGITIDQDNVGAREIKQ